MTSQRVWILFEASRFLGGMLIDIVVWDGLKKGLFEGQHKLKTTVPTLRKTMKVGTCMGPIRAERKVLHLTEMI